MLDCFYFEKGRLQEVLRHIGQINIETVPQNAEKSVEESTAEQQLFQDLSAAVVLLATVFQ